MPNAKVDLPTAPTRAPRYPLFTPNASMPMGQGRQNGIADPRWPLTYEEFEKHYTEIEGGEVSELAKASGKGAYRKFRESYERFADRMRPQERLTIVTADICTQNRTQAERRNDLIRILKKISKYSWDQMRRTASREKLRPLAFVDVPVSYRVTVTVGFGRNLFVSPTGEDRFGISGCIPRSLRIMPSFPDADDESFDPHKEAADLILIVQSDHSYVNTAVARDFAIKLDDQLIARRIEQGFARPDTRELLGFDDGTNNLKASDDIDDLVFVSEDDDEPDWCVNGSYLVYRKHIHNLQKWAKQSEPQQEQIFGRHKADGCPLSEQTAPENPRMPVYGRSGSGRGTPPASHIFKAMPRRSGPDFMGELDLNRRILRRGYPFFDSLDESGELEAGLQFMAFMKDARSHFEWAFEMWMMNKDFPHKDAGVDALFSSETSRVVAGGYYFCPPAPKPPASGIFNDDDDFFGSPMFSDQQVCPENRQ